MAAIGITDVSGQGEVAVAETTLGASDTIAFERGVKMTLFLRNASAGALTPKIDGDGGVNVFVDGIGNVDVSGGYTMASIAAGAVAAIHLDTIEAYCKGIVTITGGLAIVATCIKIPS